MLKSKDCSPNNKHYICRATANNRIYVCIKSLWQQKMNLSRLQFPIRGRFLDGNLKNEASSRRILLNK